MSLPKYAEYKESGVTSLGLIPSHWQVKRLRFAAELNPSKSEIASLDRQTEISFLPMDAIGDDGIVRLDETRTLAQVENGYTYFRDGDVVIAKITPCFENGKGAVIRGLLGGVGFGTTELIVVRPRHQQTTSDYLGWLFASPTFRKNAEGAMYGAGGQKRVPDSFVRDYLDGVPPIEEQSAIVAFLDRETGKIDALIAEQEKLLTLLAEKRQATISHAVTRGLNPSAPMKDSGVPWLGEVPAYWKVLALRRLIDQFEQGWSPECEARPADPGEWGVLKAGCVNGGEFDAQENKTLPLSLVPREELELKSGDVLMSRASGSPKLIGSVACVMNPPSHLILSDKIFRIRLSADVDPRFFAVAMGSTPLRQQIEQAIGGAEGLANNLPQASIKEFWMSLPPVEEQLAIVDFVVRERAKLDDLAGAAERAVALLKEHRSALIAAAVTGKIDVRQAA